MPKEDLTSAEGQAKILQKLHKAIGKLAKQSHANRDLSVPAVQPFSKVLSAISRQINLAGTLSSSQQPSDAIRAINTADALIESIKKRALVDRKNSKLHNKDLNPTKSYTLLDNTQRTLTTIKLSLQNPPETTPSERQSHIKAKAPQKQQNNLPK